MRTRGAEHEDGVGAGDDDAEGSDVGLAIFERDVAAVDASVQGSAGCVRSALCCSVVAIAELELDDVTNCGRDRVRIEGILRATNYYRDDL